MSIGNFAAALLPIVAAAALLAPTATAQPVPAAPKPHPPDIEKLMPPKVHAPPRNQIQRPPPFVSFRIEPVISIRLGPGANLQAIIGAADGQGVKLKPMGRPNVLRFIDMSVGGGDPTQAAAKVKGIAGVESAETNWTGHYEGTSVDDPLFEDQWSLRNDGSNGGKADADIDADEAWDITQGDPSVMIAVIDSGVEWDHPELKPNLALNEAEVNGTPGVDDDLNGKIDDFVGWDFENDDNDPRTFNDHGTAVAGIIAAAGNNGQGIAGIAGGGSRSAGCRILSINIGEFEPQGSLLDDAILYAVARGARIIALSLKMQPETSVQLALEFAAKEGVTIVCAAGNDLSYIPFPANDPHVIPVASTGRSDCVSQTSSPGLELARAGLAAPGEEILSLSLVDWGGYAVVSGTSFAAPHVAGVAGLIDSVPAAHGITPDDMRLILRSTADALPCAPDPNAVGAGRLNAGAAVRRAAGG